MMKKILCGIALVAGFVSCTEDYSEDWKSPQSNPATDPTPKTEMTAEQKVSAIDFATETGETIQLFTTNMAEGQVEGYTVEFTADDTDKTASIPATTDGTILAADLQNAIIEMYGKAPYERTLNTTVTAEVSVNTAEGSIVTRKQAAAFTLKAKLLAPHISENYYVVGGALDWGASAASKSQKFNHSDVNVYDDPIFTITIPASFNDEGARTDTWFAIGDDEALDAITFDSDWSKLLGNTKANGNTDLIGTLATRSELGNEGSICMPASDEAVAYKITLNMMDYQYTIETVSAAPETWYLVGSCIGDGSWGNSNTDNVGVSLFPLAFIGDGKIAYTGYFTTDGFKLIKTPGSWDDQWGQGAAGFVKNDGGSGNITVADAGWYTVTLDYLNDVLTIEATAAPTETYAIGMAGGFNGWAFAAMTQCPNTEHLWKTELTADGDQEGKFLIDGWGVNWGATDFPTGIGTQNGPNIPIAAGSYVVIFNDVTGGYNFIEK